jgi:DNA polymerase III gamma/tau subunit
MNKYLKACGALAVTMTVLGVAAPAQAAELKVLRLPQVTAVSKSSAIRISSTELQEIKNQNYLYDRLEELPLSKEQVDGFVDRYKDGDKKADIIDEAKEQADKNLASETDAAKSAEAAVKTAEESKSKDDVSKAREAVKALKFTKTEELTKRLDAVDAAIKEAEAKAEAERKAAEEAAAKAAAEKKAAEEAAAAQAAAAQQAQAQAQAASSGTKSFSDARAAFEQIVADYGIGASEKAMWEYIINRESGFNHYATNASSGAYGLPQSLPGSKMASAGADWQTNPYTQLKWMYGYMTSRYGSIAGAYNFWQANHWY